ncbi:outer membrane beta-barrel protein [Planctomycetota bacterium]
MNRNIVQFSIVLMIFTSVVSANITDRTVEITPFAGYGFGGEFKEYTTDTKLKVDDEPVYGFTVDWEAAETTQYEFFFSHQATGLDKSNATAPPEAKTDMNISYAHIGGLLNFGNDRVSPFICGGLGATVFDPQHYSSEVKFSINVGGGVKFFITEKFGIRLEGRGMGTLVDNSVWFHSGSGGAQIGVSGDTFWQFQLNLGLIFAI